MQSQNEPSVEYKTLPGIDGQYFFCERQNATLSVSACAQMYLEAEANVGAVYNRREKCLGCPIGAMHAGKAPSIHYRNIGRIQCARCHQHASRLVQGGICISCYNREREVVLGKNGKGGVPHPRNRFWALSDTERTHCKTLEIHRITVSTNYGGISMSGADTLEAMLKITRAETRPIQFSRKCTGLTGR